MTGRPEARAGPVRAPPPGLSHPTVLGRPSHHPSGPDSHGASSTAPSAVPRCLHGSRPAPPPPTPRQLAQPDAPPYLASDPKRAFESPIPFFMPLRDPSCRIRAELSALGLLPLCTDFTRELAQEWHGRGPRGGAQSALRERGVVTPPSLHSSKCASGKPGAVH